MVDLLDVGTLPGDEWGFTGIFDRGNGGGFLTEHYPKPAKAIWNLQGIFANSRHIPGVRFAGIPHPGLIGCAPSKELLAKWNTRERRPGGQGRTALEAGHPAAGGAAQPGERHAGHAEGTPSSTGWPARARARCRRASTAATATSRTCRRARASTFPVYVPGANLSMGDIHFSQGDGEISFCGAIEMSGYLDLHVDIIKGGVAKYGMVNPIFKPGPVEPHYSERELDHLSLSNRHN